jgi:hypothetical protein
MALTRKGAGWKFGTQGVSATGITEVTSYSGGAEYSIVVEGKDKDGDIKAVLYGGETAFCEVEGYSDSANAPALGGTISVGNASCIIFKSEIIGSNEDFAKVRVTGRGWKGVT